MTLSTVHRMRSAWHSPLLALSQIALLCLAGTVVAQDNRPPRVARGLQALYTFAAGEGTTIHDRSGISPPLNLKIENPQAIRWNEGSLLVQSGTRIASTAAASRLSDLIKRTGELTVEAWVLPANLDQEGPARIVTLSSTASQRNFTLGQEFNKFQIRLRTSATSTNGMPATDTSADSVRRSLTQIVYARDTTGTVRVYINGRPETINRITGSLANWDSTYKLLLANEASDERPWLGTYHLVAIYGRALSADEITTNFRAGAAAGAVDEAMLAEQRKAHFFTTRIAPLLANKCLDCHDAATRKGKLNLAAKTAAFSGGENGKVIIPGRSADSLLWQLVESDDMPADGEPLTAQQKFDIKQWLDEGASWSIDTIDPAVFTRNPTAAQNWLRRLTLPEYIETVRAAVGVDISTQAWKQIPRDLRADGFSNTAYNLAVDLKHIEAYSRLAEIIVERIDALKFAARFSRSRSLSTDDTMREFIASMGEWLLRGPLDEREITNYSGIATTVASAGGDYEEAVRFIIEAMLQSPRFVYRVENQLGDGTAWPINDYELASRLSYIIWGGPPDQELLRAAGAGELQDPTRLEGQVSRMLADPRAIDHSSRFVVEWLDLDRLENLKPNATRFPGWSNELAADMRAETVAFFKELVWEQKKPLTDLFNSQFTYATPLLAQHYGLDSNGPGLVRYDLSATPSRGGLLTQGSILTIGGDDASMVTRGLFVMHDVLRGVVKDPPPGLDTTPVPSKPGLSQRMIAEKRIANVACRGCHLKFEPLAFGLEHYDGIGAFHQKDEHGNELRSDGEVLVPGAAKPIEYKTPAELMDLLAASNRVRLTISWKLTQFAMGRPLLAADAAIVEKIDQAAAEAGGTYTSLITAIVMSDLVQKTRTEAPRENDDK